MSPDLQSAIDLLAEDAVANGIRNEDGSIKVDAFKIRPQLEALLETPVTLYSLRDICQHIRNRAQELDSQ